MDTEISLQPLLERSLNPKQIKYWVLSVVVFCVDVLFQIIYSYLLFLSILNQTFISYHIFIAVFYLFGIFLLGHALFVNNKFRNRFLAIYTWAFQILPICLYSFAFIALAVGFSHFKEEFQKQYSIKNGAVVVIFCMLMCLVADTYHSFAAYIIFKFRQINSGEAEALL